MLSLLAALLPLGCGPAVTAEQAADFVKEQAVAANPPGRTGVELVGRSRWVQGWMFNHECVQSKDLAFVENPGATAGIKISPTWDNQNLITAETAKGWCAYIGEGVEVTVGKPVKEGGAWKVPVTYNLSKKTPWAECLKDTVTTREVLVNWDPELNMSVDQGLELVAGDCPHPMPEGEERGKAKAPTKDAPKAPSKADVVALMQAFDAKLTERDLLGALEMVSCYNVYGGKDTYGSCAPSELIQVAPHKTGEHAGQPWTEAVIADFGDIQGFRKDPKIPGVWHAMMTHKRNKRTRSMGVQWVNGEWKLLGIIGAKGADLTSVRFIYDLHDNEKRAIFLRRLEGEAIDEKGFPLDPYAEEEEE